MMWFTIIGMACITFLNRFVFLAPGYHYKPNKKLTRFLSFSSLAVLTAIWLPMVVGVSATDGVTVAGLDYVLSSVIAALLAVFRFHSLAVVLVSSCVFFGCRLFLS